MCPPSFFFLVTHDNNVFCTVALFFCLCWSHMMTMSFVSLCRPSLFVLVTRDNNVFCIVVPSLFVCAGHTPQRCVLYRCDLALCLCSPHMTTMCFVSLCPPTLFVLVTHDNNVFCIVVPSLFVCTGHT